MDRALHHLALGPLDRAVPPPRLTPRQAYLLYDAECAFCRLSTAAILAWDRRGRLLPLPIQSSRGGKLLADLEPGERLSAFHLVGADGRRHSGAAALGPLLRLLPAGRALAPAAERFPRLAERAYGWVSEHRGALARPLSDRVLRGAQARIEHRAQRGTGTEPGPRETPG